MTEGGAGAAGRAAPGATPNRKPQDPQNKFETALTCPHWGHATEPAAGAAATTLAAAAETAGAGAGTEGARFAGCGAMATVPPSPAAAAGAAAAAPVAARMPCGGV